MTKEYCVYKGDDLLVMGTLQECANELGVKPATVLWYKYPSYQKKGNSKRVSNRRITIEMEEDEE